MEQLFNDAPRNPVPYRATRTLPNFPQNNERRFEPSWARNTLNSRMFNSNRFPIPCLPTSTPVSYTRDNIFKIINSIGGPPSSPPQDLQACPQIYSMDTSVALKLLDKSYYTPDPNDCDHMPSSYFLLSTSQPKTFESRGLSGRGRGRGMDFGGGWTNSFESNPKWPSSSRGPVWRSRFSSDSTDLPSSYPLRRVVSECSHSESLSEGLSDSPLETAPDWQYFPGDETCGDKEYNSSQNSIEPEQEYEIPLRSNYQNNTFDGKMVSWPDPNPPKFNRCADMLENIKVDYPNSTQQKEGESHSFSFLNPSHAETPDPIPNVNKSNFLTSTNSDDKFKRTHMLCSSHSDFDILNISSSNIIPDPQDPRHLWYYVDPKGNIQGPFHSDLMDIWYGRKFFPTTLPIWRECDTQSFKLVNLLNITDNSELPFFSGAELLLISKEFSLVEVPNINEVPIALPETLLDNQLATRDERSTRKTPGITLETETFDETEKCDPFILSREKAIQQSNIDTIEGYSARFPQEHSEIVTISSPHEEVFQHISLESSQEITNKHSSPEPKFTPITITEHKSFSTYSSKTNMWLSGPPKIPEQLTTVPTHVTPVVDTAQVQTSLLPSNTAVKTSKEPVYHLPSSEEMRRSSEDKRKVKSKSTSSIIDPQQDKSGWTKVGLEKKQKAKAKAKKVPLSASNQTLPQAVLTPEQRAQKNQPSSKAKHSSNRSKLDELDSFYLGRQTFPLLPLLHNGIPVVKFDTILTEQSTVEQCREDEEFIVQSKGPAWASSPTETVTASFLDIEKEQKETAKEDAARAEGIRTKEAQVADQPVVFSTWSRVTKKDKLNVDNFTADVFEVSNSEVTQTVDTVLCVPIMETDRTIQIPVINTKSEVYGKPKNTATKALPSRIVSDGILLSPACYEWAEKEILSLNEWMDPPTVITALQDFNGLFEITQLGSEMFGTSERTNALCKRIYEDLAKVKKYKYKTTQLQSVDDEWVKISKKSNKSTKKKGKPSKSSED